MMRDVTTKPDTLREAVAVAELRLDERLRELVAQGAVAKGDVRYASELVAHTGAKETARLLPFCHPIPITGLDVVSELTESGLRFEVTVRTIAPTGVEMEALTAATLAALNAYDMLKPHVESDEELTIAGVTLVRKRGGKSQYRRRLDPPVRAAVVVLSDTVAAGKKEDRAGKAVVAGLEAEPSIELVDYQILPDEPDQLRERVKGYVDEGIDLVITVGGTGLGPRDTTVEALRPLFDREIPGVMEAARAYGQRRTPYAMLSRGTAGLIGGTLVLTFPGSTKGARETYDALFPGVLHIFETLRKIPHEHGHR